MIKSGKKSNIESPVNIKKIRLNMKKKEAKKMKKLQKKYGTITIELYNYCKNELQYYPTFCYYYTTQAASKYSHLHNIVALYLYQIHPIHLILINKKDYLIFQFRHL